MDHFNKLSPAEAERLAMMIEECNEVATACTKILRHGYDSHHPDDRNHPGNRAALEDEIVDVLAVRSLMIMSGDIRLHKELDVANALECKLYYAHHQGGVDDYDEAVEL